MTPILALVILICLCFVWIMKNAFGKRNLPPGPPPLPIFGNTLQIKKSSFLAFQKEMRCKYGNIFTFYLGMRPVVAVSGYQELKDALYHYGDVFSGRGNTPGFNSFYNDSGFVFTSDIKRWRELRRFSIWLLRDAGMGKAFMESAIQEEAEYLVKEFAKHRESPCDPSHRLSQATGNVICKMMFANRYDYYDEELDLLIHRMSDTFFHIGSLSWQLFNVYPGIMKYLPGTYKAVHQNMECLASFTRKIVEEHQKTLDPSAPRDFVDSFLLKMEKEKDDPNTEYYMKNLISTTLQTFFAGTQTTSTVLTYGLLLFLKHPEIQENVQNEIDEIIGRSRSPKYQDRRDMPYTDAVIHEILRYSDLVPFSLPRMVTKDTDFHGYNIPKGTDVYLSLTSVLNDPNIFPNPETFNPGNFLDEDGKFKKNDAFLVFAAGKRNCTGESLARMEMFLFLATILQSFKLRSPIPLSDVDIRHIVTGFWKFPKHYTLCFEPR